MPGARGVGGLLLARSRIITAMSKSHTGKLLAIGERMGPGAEQSAEMS